MRTRSVVATLATVSVMLPAALLAQRRSAIEVGGFGRFTILPDTLNVNSVFGAGGRLGYYIWPGLSVEGEASFGVTHQKRVPAGVADSFQDVSHTLWQARLLYNTPRAARTSFLIGAGYVYDGFGRERYVAPRGQGVSALLGLRWYLTNRISARFEANGYYIFADDSSIPYPRKATFTPNFQVGLSGLFRNAPSVPTIVTRFDTVRVTEVKVDTIFRDRIAEATTTTASGGSGLARGATVVIGVVNFDFDKFELSSDARRILDDVATSLARPEAANLNLVVTGNTDAIGGESYNARLGENRAKAVSDYLVGKGVTQSRITQRSAGETNPVASNTNPEGRATNRRVLIELQNGAP
jgi:outer membrane protein OmpA-like peptidoglycan-associated protein